MKSSIRHLENIFYDSVRRSSPNSEECYHNINHSTSTTSALGTIPNIFQVTYHGITKRSLVIISIYMLASSISISSLIMIMIHNICSKHSGHIKRQDRFDGHLPHVPETDHKAAHEHGHRKMEGSMMCLNERLPQDMVDVVTVLYLLSGAEGFLMWHFSGIPTSQNPDKRRSIVKIFSLVIPILAIFLIIYFLTQESFSKLNLVIFSAVGFLGWTAIKVTAQIQELDEKYLCPWEIHWKYSLLKHTMMGCGFLIGSGINLIKDWGEMLTLYLSLFFLLCGAFTLFSKDKQDDQDDQNDTFGLMNADGNWPNMTPVADSNPPELIAQINQDEAITDHEVYFQLLWEVVICCFSSSMPPILILVGVTSYKWEATNIGLYLTLKSLSCACTKLVTETGAFRKLETRLTHPAFSFEYFLTTNSTIPMTSFLFGCASIISILLIKGSLGLYLSSLLLGLSNLTQQRGEFRNSAFSVNAAKAFVITRLVVSFMAPILSLRVYFYVAKGFYLLFLVVPTGIAVILVYAYHKFAFPFEKEEWLQSSILLEEYPSSLPNSSLSNQIIV